MSKIKKTGSLDKDQNLKRKDSKKNHADGSSGILLGAPFGSNKKLPDSMVDTEITNVKVKKKLPIAVDIIAGILMLLIVLGVIVGSYIAFRIYSNDSINKNVTYDIIISQAKEIEYYENLIGQDVFLDTTSNSLYFGEVVDVVSIIGKSDQVLIKVNATVKYKKGEGYSIDTKRLAVGSEFSKLRCGESILTNASVVRLSLNGGN